ncbi:MAG: hypothetical protein PHW62_00600 [Candidatus Ratteibacteria bacterium]|nr:hypothetical protein [Candidatus Ratteibacteria bacterium]
MAEETPMKYKKGKGWHGDTPGHKAAANKKVVKGILKTPMYRKEFTLQDAKRIGNILGVDWTRTPVKEYRVGLNMELGEHGRKGGDVTNITNDDELTVGKIALAHITEFPNYYNDKTGLPVMERKLKS